jgi:NADP-dependent 3-hydroxy acid dehydrogenase YdfG
VARKVRGVGEGVGMFDLSGRIHGDAPDQWAQYVDLNLYGVLNCCRAVIEPMTRRGWGRIIGRSRLDHRPDGHLDGGSLPS